MQATTPGSRARVVRMIDYCEKHEVPEVPDPYYGGGDGFERVLDVCEAACRGLLQHIRELHEL
jgi:protein-tyrosine phosphatase